MQSRTDFGPPGYGGACPPPGSTHRYVLTVYALDVPSLGLTPDTPPFQVRRRLEAHALARANIISIYGR